MTAIESETRELYADGPLTIVGEIRTDLGTVPAAREFRDADHRRDYLDRFDRLAFEFVTVTARVFWKGTLLAEESERGVEHGRTAAGVCADAWEWRVPAYPGPDDCREGSMLNYVVSGALTTIELEHPDDPQVQAAVKLAWDWADPHATEWD